MVEAVWWCVRWPYQTLYEKIYVCKELCEAVRKYCDPTHIPHEMRSPSSLSTAPRCHGHTVVEHSDPNPVVAHSVCAPTRCDDLVTRSIDEGIDPDWSMTAYDR